jgi:hypothetical protein
MSQVLDLFRDAQISGAPVISAAHLVGIISIEDLIRALLDGKLQATVAHYMTGKLITVTAADPIIEALKLFSQTRLGRLVVTDRAGQLAGIITKGDITRGLLTALQRDYQVEEVRRYRASHLFEDIISDRTSLILRYNVKPGDFTHGGTASSHIKRTLLRLGANPQIALDGGMVRVEINPPLILMETFDDGPGIADIELAMKPGYSTASEKVRELGFGAGMGLKNIQRCVDEMQLESTPGKGTRLEMRIYLPPAESFGETKPF